MDRQVCDGASSTEENLLVGNVMERMWEGREAAGRLGGEGWSSKREGQRKV